MRDATTTGGAGLPTRRSRALNAALAIAALAGAAHAPAAAGAAPRLHSTERFAIAIPAVAAGDCAARAAAGPGTVRRRIAPGASGVLEARLRGPAGGDWDLGVVDARSGRTLAGSAGTGSGEVAAARVRRGRPVVVQACRRAGAGSGGTLTVRVARARLQGGRRSRAVAEDPRAAGRLPSGRTRYRTLPEMQLELKALAASNPDLVRTFTLPLRSTEGREVMGVEVAERVAAPPDGRPAFVLVGTVHAREWPAGEAAAEWVHELVQGYRRGDPRLTAIARGARTHVLPVLNVDGLDTTLSAAGLHPDGTRERALPSGIFGSGPHKRKSCSDPARRRRQRLPCLARAGGADRGVDFNRNFTPGWGGPGSHDEPLLSAYAGPRPFSEPETEGLRRRLRDLQPAVTVANHTFSGLVIRPPGTRGRAAPADMPLLRDLGAAMARATGYRSIRGFELYAASGTLDDYVGGALGGLPLTLEIGRRGFHPPYLAGVASQYDGAMGGLREAYALASEAAVDPAGHGIIRGTSAPGRILHLRGRGGEPRRSSLVVPADGRFTWHVTGPPLQTWELTCGDALGRVLERQSVAVARGAAVDVILPCSGAPGATLEPRRR